MVGALPRTPSGEMISPEPPQVGYDVHGNAKRFAVMGPYKKSFYCPNGAACSPGMPRLFIAFRPGRIAGASLHRAGMLANVPGPAARANSPFAWKQDRVMTGRRHFCDMSRRRLDSSCD